MKDIKALGVNFQCNSPISGKAGAEKLLQDGFDAVFLAPGLWGAASIKSTDRAIDGLFSSVDYLSALRDGRFEEIEKKIQGKIVAVIGGGSVAMDCIESAIRLEAKDVYLIYRRLILRCRRKPMKESRRLIRGSFPAAESTAGLFNR